MLDEVLRLLQKLLLQLHRRLVDGFKDLLDRLREAGRGVFHARRQIQPASPGLVIARAQRLPEESGNQQPQRPRHDQEHGKHRRRDTRKFHRHRRHHPAVERQHLRTDSRTGQWSRNPIQQWDNQHGRQPQHNAEPCQEAHPDPHRPGHFRRMAGMGAARLCQKRHPERLRKTSQRQRARQSQHRGGNRQHQLQKQGRQLEAEKQTLKHQPLADEPVGGRKGGDGDGADQKEGACPRHAPEQAAVLFDLSRMGGELYRPRAEKQQRLERRVVDGMVQTRQ